MPSIPTEDRRTIADRRLVATSWWDSVCGAGRRMKLRRRDEHAREYFVDRFAPMTLLLILLFLLLSIVDAVLTIQLLPAGCGEANPLMACLLDRGVMPFLVGKYVLTAAGLPILLLYQNFKLFGTRFRVFYLLPALVALYIILLVYQLSLLQTHVGL